MAGPRSQARLYAVLGLYQWQIAGNTPDDILEAFGEDGDWAHEIAEAIGEATSEKVVGPEPGYDKELLRELVFGVVQNLEAVDAGLANALDRPIERVDPVERAILRCGGYELIYCPNMPGPVIINEAIELAKALGAEQGHRYVNGVLDRLRRKVRGDSG